MLHWANHNLEAWQNPPQPGSTTVLSRAGSQELDAKGRPMQAAAQWLLHQFQRTNKLDLTHPVTPNQSRQCQKSNNDTETNLTTPKAFCHVHSLCPVNAIVVICQPEEITPQPLKPKCPVSSNELKSSAKCLPEYHKTIPHPIHLIKHPKKKHQKKQPKNPNQLKPAT